MASTSPHTCSSATCTDGAHATAPTTDQNSGDLHPFLHALQEDVPANGGELPVGELLLLLKAKRPEVFARLDGLFETARCVSGLDESMALKWKEKGNAEYKRRQHQQAVLSYTNGLLCAEAPETLAVLLNNRSTAFFDEHRYADACVDADRAVQYQPHYWKALQRRGRSLVELGLTELGEKDMAASRQESSEAANTPEVMAKVFGEATSGMAAACLPPRAHVSAEVRVERSAKGRGLAAASRLTEGQVLEETPYALVARTEALLSVCSYCLQHSACLYHGDEYRQHRIKSRGFFCSPACARAAWEHYGQHESRHPFFLCCPNDALLAYRMLLGTRAYPALAELTASPELDPVTGNDFGAQHMRTLTGSFSRELQPNAAVGGYESIVAAIGLYVGALSEVEAEQLRKAQRQILLNSVDVTCTMRTAAAASAANSASLLQTNTSVAHLGKAVYAVGALFNHACDPNCFVSFEGNPQGSCARLTVRTIRPVMEGEELTVSYGGISCFSFHSMRHRLQTLRDRYGFFCSCLSCRNQVDEPVPTAEKEKYIKASDYYQKGRRLVREGDYATAVTVLLQSYEIVMRYICPPPHPPQWMLIKTHDALAQAYFHLKQQDKCVEHLQAALRLDVEIHKNANRVELINEHTRLAFLATDMADKKVHASKAVELLRRFYSPSSMLNLQIAYVESSLRITSSSPNNTGAAAATA
ncbi:SET domain/TPR repeat/Tetratricopeptide repeat [Novymonas esmeraldas]|uniref:SET domain/TPR repeat/Tetratricopeptide repeat n=1 Tax=Novymonas esmeraldas TaxID=1808958 RepID=A0AAW0EVM3_9TRYP